MSHEELDVIWDVLEGLAQGLDVTYDNQRRLAKRLANADTEKPEKSIHEYIQEARQDAKDNYR